MVEYWETMVYAKVHIHMEGTMIFFESVFVRLCLYSLFQQTILQTYLYTWLCKYDNDVNDKIVGNFEYIWEKIEGTKLLLKYVSCVSLYLYPLFQKTAYASFYCAMQFTFERKLNWNCTNIQ
jgi:hypothetical protein